MNAGRRWPPWLVGLGIAFGVLVLAPLLLYGLLVLLPDPDDGGWREHVRARIAAVPPDGDAGRGALLYARHCAVCHEAAAYAPLREVARWAGTRRPGQDARAYLIESIIDPQAYVAPSPGRLNVMPQTPVSPAEVADLVAHLLSR